ncbi:hypothetical protein U1Q18_034390 [Sarracenia purpurea var. burkii]
MSIDLQLPPDNEASWSHHRRTRLASTTIQRLMIHNMRTGLGRSVFYTEPWFQDFVIDLKLSTISCDNVSERSISSIGVSTVSMIWRSRRMIPKSDVNGATRSAKAMEYKNTSIGSVPPDSTIRAILATFGEEEVPHPAVVILLTRLLRLPLLSLESFQFRSMAMI